MRGLAVIAFALATFIAGPVVAADDFPDLKGTWTGKGEGVFVSSPGSPTQSHFSSVDMTLVIDAQEDRRFAGTITMAGSTRPVVGVITESNRLLWSEPGGFVEGHLADANTIEGCFLRVSEFSQLAACEALKRQQ